MGKCSICTREIPDGQELCQMCQQNRQTLKPVDNGGFSLSGLLKTPPEAPSSPTPAPSAMTQPPIQPPPVKQAPVSPPSAPPVMSQPTTAPRQAPPVVPQQPPVKPPTVSPPPVKQAPVPPPSVPSATAQPTTAPQKSPSVASQQPPVKPPPVSPPLVQKAKPTGIPVAPQPAKVADRPQLASKAVPANEKSSLLKPKKNMEPVVLEEPPDMKNSSDELQKELFSSEMTGFGDEELEISLLAGLLKDSFILTTLMGKGLMPGLFSTKYSRAIFVGIVNLREENPNLSSVDKIVIKNKLQQKNLWNPSVEDFLNKIIASSAPAMDQVLHYLEMMKEQALKRKLKEISHNIIEYIDNPVKNDKTSLEAFASGVIKNVRDIQRAKATKKIGLVREEMVGILKDMERREVEGEIDIIGYSFEPMTYLNKALSGFRKGFMYAIAGAPRRGKTTFTLELATRVATLNKIPVLFFTYEQTKKNLTYRLIAKESRLNPGSLQRKKIKSDMIMDAKFQGGWRKMEEYMDYFHIIEATKEDTIDKIRSYAYNVMQDFNTDDIMIFVDYIQKMPLSRDYMDEKFKVEEISTELKGLCIELNNPIMTISSLSKEGCMIDATNDAERPTMYHCKGSGDLEYDLDSAMIQSKDWGDTRELYLQLQHKAEELGKDSTRVPKVDVVNLYLDKNRDAPEGIFSIIQYLFFIEDNKFIELGPKFEDDRYRFSKIEELVDKLIEQNYIIFHEKPEEASINQGRVSIKLKNF